VRGAAVLAAVAALALAAYAQARPATAVLDKTLICTLEYNDVNLLASPRGDLAFATAQMISSGFLGVSSADTDHLSHLVAVRARDERSTVGSSRGPQGVYARARRCFLSRKSVPLSSAGLPGPPVVWKKDYSCTVRGRIVVRVRAVLAASASWRRVDDQHFGVRANIVSAKLAVRSEKTGKPLAFSTLDSAGKTKLWVANRCS
jgi:hypothetical protein